MTGVKMLIIRFDLTFYSIVDIFVNATLNIILQDTNNTNYYKYNTNYYKHIILIIINSFA